MLLTARRRGAAGQTNSSNSACGLAVDAGALCASEQNCMFDCQARKLYVWSEAAATRDDARLACGALNFWQLAGAGANISAPSGLATLVVLRLLPGAAGSGALVPEPPRQQRPAQLLARPACLRGLVSRRRVGRGRWGSSRQLHSMPSAWCSG